MDYMNNLNITHKIQDTNKCYNSILKNIQWRKDKFVRAGKWNIQNLGSGALSEGLLEIIKLMFLFHFCYLCFPFSDLILCNH